MLRPYVAQLGKNATGRVTAPRARIGFDNRANAQHSTGPKSAIGKLRSSQNSFQHGLYSKQLILPGEDAAEFDHLRATLRNEHQPANTVEEILVEELAQHFWRIRRFRELEARSLQPENLDSWCNNGLFALIQRSMASAERSFHKSLTALSKLQKAHGFVPQVNAYQANSHTHHIEYEEEDQGETGFVPSNTIHVLLETDQEVDFDPSPLNGGRVLTRVELSAPLSSILPSGRRAKGLLHYTELYARRKRLGAEHDWICRRTRADQRGRADGELA